MCYMLLLLTWEAESIFEAVYFETVDGDNLSSRWDSKVDKIVLLSRLRAKV